MKKKIIFLSLIFILSASAVFAQGTGKKNSDAENSVSAQEQENKNSEQGSAGEESQIESAQGGSESESVQAQTQAQNQEETQNQEQVQQQTEGSNGENAGEQVQQQTRARNVEELKIMIKDKKQKMDQEIQNIKDKKQQLVYKNQNAVREAVHALLAMRDLLETEDLETEDLTRGIGQQVSEIAREFNNSVEKTIKAEEKIQKRNMVVKFFFGGDEESAENILQEVNKNKEKLQNLKNLRQQCDCAEEVKNLVQEQIQNIEQEQIRLQEVAQNQKAKKGLFGWIFGWMKR